ncbi:MAG: diaminopimelate decarboxylase, partial [Gammaproteobacteria bacterium]
AVLNVMARLGSGFDIVSGGELARVMAAGGDPAKVVFSGVGKRADEIRQALDAGIRCFNAESTSELRVINSVAATLGVVAPVALRVNPDVDPRTHPYISTGLKENKFGIDISEAEDVYRLAADMSNLHVTGIGCHIGSQLTELSPFVDALERVLALADRLGAQGIEIDHLDLGGGLGIRYQNESPPLPHQYATTLFEALPDDGREIMLEPGRAIMGNAGILVARVEYLKHMPHKNFAVVDAAMNDLLRPALYQAAQEIIAVIPRNDGNARCYDVVGPVCETGDFIGKQRELDLQEGDLLAVRSAGAYGFCMSSNYNARLRAAEVMVDGERSHLARARERIDDLMRGESILQR